MIITIDCRCRLNKTDLALILDNAWMETVAANFHDEDGTLMNQLKFEAGDDAVGVSWIDCDSKLKLYASHSKLVEGVAKLRNAHF